MSTPTKSDFQALQDYLDKMVFQFPKAETVEHANGITTYRDANGTPTLIMSTADHDRFVEWAEKHHD